jgi:acyl carrier protein
MTSVEQKLRKIVTETFLVGGDRSELRGDDSFIETGIIDSTGILQLVEFVEQEFSFKVEDEDLIPENLDSIDRLVAFVERKKVLSAMGVKHPGDAMPFTVGTGSLGTN